MTMPILTEREDEIMQAAMTAQWLYQCSESTPARLADLEAEMIKPGTWWELFDEEDYEWSD